MSTQTTLLDVTKTYDRRTVLSGVTCSLSTGERTGVIGENGSGKSTLLRLLAGEEQPDSGRVIVSADGGVGYVPQDSTLPPQLTVQQVTDRALGELRAMEARLRELEAAMTDGDESALSDYGELLSVFELRGGYDAGHRLERALHGLGLRRLPGDRLVGDLSGGEHSRLRLAATLAAGPELLLLDEPTNHLDDNALTWLEEHLRSRRGTTVAVSHDRVFLERVAHSLLEVDADHGQVRRYGNGYADYLTERAADRQRRAQAHEDWRTEVARLRTAVATTARRVAPGRGMTDRNKMAYGRAAGRVQQSLASRVRNAEERLRRALADPVPPPPEPLRFTPSLRAEPHRGTVLEATDVAVTGRLAATSVTLAAGERLLLTGENGSGKSTLLRVLAGELSADRGRLARRGRVGYLAQDPAGVGSSASLLASFARGRPGPLDEQAERLLALGLFRREQLHLPVGALSTGGRRRLALARLVSEPADVLLLDEPTNHLSLALVEELEEALAGFPGALLLASHDRRLRERWTGGHLTPGSARPADVPR